MKSKKPSMLYRVIKKLVQIFYPKIEVIGVENLPDEPVVVVSNHAQMNGPIACELYYPDRHFIWCAGQMMHLKEVPGYAFQDFWSRKPKWCRWLYKLLSYAIAPLSVCVFNHANTIPVYRDFRLKTTFKMSMAHLAEGSSIIIFPEYDKPYNHILYDFEDRFIDLARMYYKKMGIELSFVPIYLAPALKKMYIGKPIRFCSKGPVREERTRICNHLMTEITEIACSLPEHTVVPYRNIPKRYYPTNLKGNQHEKTCC